MIALNNVLELLQAHGLLLLFLIAVVEGPIVTVLAAYLASLGYLNIFAVYGVVVLSDLVGDSICYVVGRFGHGPVLGRWGPRFGLDERRLAALEAHFRRRGGKTLLIGKLTHSAGFFVLLAAGAARMQFGQFRWYNFIGTLPKSLFFVIVGYTLGYAYEEIDADIFRASVVILIIAGALGLYWLAHKRGNRA